MSEDNVVAFRYEERFTYSLLASSTLSALIPLHRTEHLDLDPFQVKYLLQHKLLYISRQSSHDFWWDNLSKSLVLDSLYFSHIYHRHSINALLDLSITHHYNDRKRLCCIFKGAARLTSNVDCRLKRIVSLSKQLRS